MTAVCTEWARRHGAVRLAAPDRPRTVFTAARARGERTPPIATANTADDWVTAAVRVWVALVPSVAAERPVAAV